MKLPKALSSRRPSQPKQSTRFGVIEDMIVERLRLRRAQAFSQDLLLLEDHWVWVLPLLVLVGWRTYSRERRKVLMRREGILARNKALLQKLKHS